MTLTGAHLITALRNSAKDGDWDRLAAVELLISHDMWLRKNEFRAWLRVERENSTTFAWVDFMRAADALSEGLRASASELAMLRLACSLAGAMPECPGREWSIRALLSSLDDRNAHAAVRAFSFAATGSAGDLS